MEKDLVISNLYFIFVRNLKLNVMEKEYSQVVIEKYEYIIK